MISDAMSEFEGAVEAFRKSVEHYHSKEFNCPPEDLKEADAIAAAAAKLATRCERFRMRPGYDVPLDNAERDARGTP